MSQLGQKRKFGHAIATSALPSTADIYLRTNCFPFWDEVPSSAAKARLQFGSVIQENVGFDFEPASYSGNIVDRDVALGPLDPAQVRPIDTALMGQRLLGKTTLRPKATHIPCQNVPQRPFVSLFHGPISA